MGNWFSQPTTQLEPTVSQPSDNHTLLGGQSQSAPTEESLQRENTPEIKPKSLKVRFRTEADKPNTFEEFVSGAFQSQHKQQPDLRQLLSSTIQPPISSEYERQQLRKSFLQIQETNPNFYVFDQQTPYSQRDLDEILETSFIVCDHDDDDDVVDVDKEENAKQFIEAEDEARKLVNESTAVRLMISHGPMLKSVGEFMQQSQMIEELRSKVSTSPVEETSDEIDKRLFFAQQLERIIKEINEASKNVNSKEEQMALKELENLVPKLKATKEALYKPRSVFVRMRDVFEQFSEALDRFNNFISIVSSICGPLATTINVIRMLITVHRAVIPVASTVWWLALLVL